jgi:hypothetical protein
VRFLSNAIETYTNPRPLDPIVQHVTSTHLGSQPRWAYSSANVALATDPSSDILPESQPTHSDAYFEHPTYPFALVISIPLITMTPENGTTEVWLGTHDGFDSRLQEAGTSIKSSGGGIGDERKNERRKTRPEVQPVVKKGSAVVRDIRLWHGGKPNLSQDHRVLLSMGEHPSIFASRESITYLNMAYSAFCSLVSKQNAHASCRYIEGGNRATYRTGDPGGVHHRGGGIGEVLRESLWWSV